MNDSILAAFKTVSNACSSVNTTLQNHQQIQDALKLIYAELEKEKEKEKEKKQAQ